MHVCAAGARSMILRTAQAVEWATKVEDSHSHLHSHPHIRTHSPLSSRIHTHISTCVTFFPLLNTHPITQYPGPLCAQCQDNWVIGADNKLCIECTEENNESSYTLFFAIFSVLMLLMPIAVHLRRHMLICLHACAVSRVERT